MKNIARSGLGYLLAFAALAPLGGCALQPAAEMAPNPAPGLYATFWNQKAPEYRATTRGAFAHARPALDRALASRDWTAAVEQMGKKPLPKPTAIILDIDETVLNNSPLYARQVRNPAYAIGPGWGDWTKQANAQRIDGAVDLINYALSRGVNVFFVSNRPCTLDAATAKNLKEQGFPIGHPHLHLLNLNSAYGNPEQRLICPEMEATAQRTLGVTAPHWYANKGNRRAAIAGKFRIILLFGDSQGDFYSLFPAPSAPADERKRLLLDHLTPQEREGIYARYGRFFDDRWIALPNSMYGNWLDSYNGYRALDIAQQTVRDAAMLNTGEEK